MRRELTLSSSVLLCLSRFAACLAADHAAVLQPDVDAPFTDVADVVNRLLPYHVFQQPDEDLNSLLNRKRSKGKERARRHDVRQEIEGEGKFADPDRQS